MKFKIIAAIIAILAIVAAGYIWYKKGLSEGTAKSEIAVSEFQRQVESLNARLAERQVVIVERVINNYHTETRTIRETAIRNQPIIQQAVRPAQGSTDLSQGYVYAHDQSVRILPIDFDLAADTRASGVSPAQGLTVVTENYRIAQENAAQLTALQNWIRETRNAQAAINSLSTDD